MNNTLKKVRELADYFAERNVEATGDWRAAVEDVQHRIDYLLATLDAAASEQVEPKPVSEMTVDEALQELVDQAQELDMGYGQNACPTCGKFQPAQAQVVPEASEWLESQKAVASKDWCSGWNACRDSMISAAPALPTPSADALKSRRMPVDMTEAKRLITQLWGRLDDLSAADALKKQGAKDDACEDCTSPRACQYHGCKKQEQPPAISAQSTQTDEVAEGRQWIPVDGMPGVAVASDEMMARLAEMKNRRINNAAVLPPEPTDELLLACGWESWKAGEYIDRGAATERYNKIRAAALQAAYGAQHGNSE